MINVTFIFWNGTSSFRIVRFCVWSTDILGCGWQVFCVEIFWRSGVKVDQLCCFCVLFLFGGFQQEFSLIRYCNYFLAFFLNVATSFWKWILIFLLVSKMISFFISSVSILSNLLKVLGVSAVMLNPALALNGSFWMTCGWR